MDGDVAGRGAEQGWQWWLARCRQTRSGDDEHTDEDGGAGAQGHRDLRGRGRPVRLSASRDRVEGPEDGFTVPNTGVDTSPASGG